MLAKTVGTVRYCYNWGLQRWNEMHKNGELCNACLLSRLWTKERPEWAKEVARGTQTKAFLNLGKAFVAFFQKKNNKPTFRKKGKKDSFYVSNDKAWLKPGHRVHLPNIGDVKMAEDLRFSGKILRYTVSVRAGIWYVSISVELPDPPPAQKEVTSPVGVDVGATHWAVVSDGTIFDAPNTIAKKEKRLKRYQHMMARREKGSKNREKAQQKFAREHKRIHDIKFDAIHKFTSQLVKNHDLVCCENLNVSAMGTSTRLIRKAVHSSCMAEIRRQLSYKAKHYVEVDRFFPSSKQCSSCGFVREKLHCNDRTFRCPRCGVTMDRDFNASINLCKEGLRVYTEGHSGSACGERRST